MKGMRLAVALILALGIGCAPQVTTVTTVITEIPDGSNPYLGYWDLTLANGAAGWLGITQETAYGRFNQVQEYLDGSLMWGSGSVVPVSSVYLDGDALIVTLSSNVARMNAEGETIRTQTY
ncbi:hypothetical protein ACFL4K_02035, partial [Candidatus Neomarinimicrobiota bacterium]